MLHKPTLIHCCPLSPLPTILHSSFHYFTMAGPQDPQPHLSIAWVLGDQRSALERALSQLASQLLRSPLLPSQHGHAAVQNLRPLHPLQAEPATDGNQNQGQGGKYGDGDGKSEEACGDLKVFRCELCVHEILCRVGIKEHVVWQQER